MEKELAGKSLSLTTGGITLLSVLLGIGVTVGWTAAEGPAC